MRIRHLAISAVLLALLASCLAADVSGNWSGSMSMGDNQLTLNYVFEQEGDKLTGTVTGPQGAPLKAPTGVSRF